jgi:predicted transposase YbfD/YdcC
VVSGADSGMILYLSRHEIDSKLSSIPQRTTESSRGALEFICNCPAVKENQPHLYEDIVATFTKLREQADSSLSTYTTCEKGHGRIETRRYWVTACLDQLRTADEWRALQSIGMVESERVINSKTTHETRYYISCREPDAQAFGERVRGQWSIENSLHWVLDVALREDESRIRKGHSAENMAVVRHIAVNLLRQEKTLKVGTQAKRLRAASDNAYLGKVIRCTVG